MSMFPKESLPYREEGLNETEKEEVRGICSSMCVPSAGPPAKLEEGEKNARNI